MMSQDLKCAICYAEEHGVTLDEMGITGAVAQWDAAKQHDDHMKGEVA